MGIRDFSTVLGNYLGRGPMYDTVHRPKLVRITDTG